MGIFGFFLGLLMYVWDNDCGIYCYGEEYGLVCFVIFVEMKKYEDLIFENNIIVSKYVKIFFFNKCLLIKL